ncbi:receptor-transporting protein 3-like [Antechinus flavipes]|uniref:receptor-transporting protein 3-like n=1 Tax=Antechinus flavipes TaxID=38775 RepID=UPI0022363004|nr:receptor-transporting protein 3-like [Antechinus flavipes]
MIKDMDLWEQTFQRIIREKKPHHRWKLKVDNNLEVKSLRPGWKQYTQKGLARFRCSLCGRSWVSAQVLILFWMCLKEPYGRVKMRVFGQRCQKCSRALFEEPEFSPEGVEKVLGCLVVRILLKCYRESARAAVPSEDPLREILVAARRWELRGVPAGRLLPEPIGRQGLGGPSQKHPHLVPGPAACL